MLCNTDIFLCNSKFFIYQAHLLNLFCSFFLGHLTMEAFANSTLTDTTQLNWLETKWEQMYEGRNPLIVTGVFAFLMHEIVYFGRFIPFLICDFIPYFQKYKLQEVNELIDTINGKLIDNRLK